MRPIAFKGGKFKCDNASFRTAVSGETRQSFTRPHAIVARLMVCASLVIGGALQQLSASTFAQPASDTGHAVISRESQIALNQLPRAVADGKRHVIVGDMLFPVDAGDVVQSATSGNVWSGGAVYYVFDGSVSTTNRALWRQAAAEWSGIGAVSFTEGSGHGNYISVRNADANNSYVGMLGGAQTMNIHDWQSKWTIVHEIGHALGLIHEHSRSDRDTYVTIFTANIMAGQEQNFDVESAMTYGAYDFASVMHYQRDAWSSNGHNTIEPRSAYRSFLNTMGYPTKLSSLDRSGLLQRYGATAVNPPSVQTLTATQITSSSAVIRGRVMSENGAPVDGRFFFWGPDEARYEVGDENITVSGDSFETTVTGLMPNKTYHFIAFSHNSSSMDLGMGEGWGGGEFLSFTTPATTQEFPLNLYADPQVGGTVTGAGSFAPGTSHLISATVNRGWNFSAWSDGAMVTSRTITMPSEGGLTLVAKFTPRPDVKPPTVVTFAAALITSHSAILEGRITDDGGMQVGGRAFQWGTSQQFDRMVSNEEVRTFGSDYSAMIDGLTPNTTYYFRAVGMNSSVMADGIGNGDILSFTTPADTAAQPVNISTRLSVQTGNNVLIGGFIVSGNTPKRVLVRALGPSLSTAFATGALKDPQLELYGDGDTPIATNNDWEDTQATELAQTGIAPGDPHEAAIIRLLPPGSYTAVVRGTNNTTGTGLLEIYDLEPGADSKLVNISTRGLVQAGDDVMIAGFIMAGAQTGDGNVGVRVIGPSLQEAGLTGALLDPTLDLYDANGALLERNDDWHDGPHPSRVQAAWLAPASDKESAILTALPPGAYTAVVRGVNGTSGIASVEVYNLR